MKQNSYPIESVEIYYNGKTETFDRFLASLLHDYLSTDNFSPDREDTEPATKKASVSL